MHGWTRFRRVCLDPPNTYGCIYCQSADWTWAFILSGINKPHLSMWSSSLAAIINPITCLILIHLIGYYGVPVGMFISICISGGYFLFLIHNNIIGTNAHFYVKILTKPILVSIILCLLIYIVNLVAPLNNYLYLSLCAFLYTICIMCLMFSGSYFDRFDYEVIAKLLSRNS